MKKLFSLSLLLMLFIVLAGCVETTEFTVTFDTGDLGPAVSSQVVKEGEFAKRPTPEPAMEGYIFLGWFKEADGETEWRFNSMAITANTTIYGLWEAGKAIETFDLGGREVSIYTHRAQEFDPRYVENSANPFAERWNAEDTVYWDIVEDIVDDIEARYNCVLKFVDANNYAQSWPHLSEMYAAGTMYDIVAITGEEFPYMYMNDMVQELPDGLLADEVIDLFWGGADGFQYNAIRHLEKRWGISLSNTIFDIRNTEKDGTYPQILYYNEDVLRDAGITKMPGEYFLDGEWSWSVFENMITQVRTNSPSVYGLADHAYNAGIMNFLGTNGTFLFDSYGALGFYSQAAQEVYAKWNSWYGNQIIRNYTYDIGGDAPDSWHDQRWFMAGDVAFTSGRYVHATNYWGDINYSAVPYPFGPGAAKADGTIDENKYLANTYSSGYFWHVPKGKNAGQMYQIIAEYMNGLKEYYSDADDEEATLQKFADTLFSFDDEAAFETLKFIQRNMNLFIIQSAVPNGIFRQAIRENYTKSSGYYGDMMTYLLSRRAELDPNNPNNFWRCIFGEPGTPVS